MFPEEFPHFGETGVGTALVEGGTVLLRIHTHAAELVYIERTAKTADTFLLVDGGAAVFPLHGNIADQEKRGKDNEGYQRQNAISYAFHIALQAIHTVTDETVITDRCRILVFHILGALIYSWLQR